jgi:sialidase-1
MFSGMTSDLISIHNTHLLTISPWIMRPIHTFLLLACMLTSAFSLSAQILPSSAFHVNRSGLTNAWHAFKKTGKGRVAFMGGSITEGAGWRDSVCQYLSSRFPETTFEFINAGISSTGSTPGAFRFSQDVLAAGPVDLLFEEAAVNDPTNGFTATYQLRGMEGIIRQARISNPNMDVIIMHCVDPDKLADYDKGVVPEVIGQHERVAEHYRANTIHLAKEVYARIKAGEFTWKDDFKDLHPSPFGHGVYARSIRTFLSAAFEQAENARPGPHKLPKMIDPASYSMGHYVNIKEASDLKGFMYNDFWRPTDGAGTRKRYVSVPVLEGNIPGSELTLSFKGKGVGICITSGPDAGMVEYEIDGRIRGMKQLHTRWSQSLHLPWYIMLEDELSPGSHTLKLRISSEKDERSKGSAVRIHQFLVNGPKE